MKAKRVIPCLDVKDGRVVKGVRFAGFQDAGDPAELAEFYSKEGADELVLFDITASAEDRATMLDVIERAARRADIPLTIGGGVATVDDMERLFHVGAQKVCINSAAVKDPSLIRRGAERFGSQRIVLAIDAMRRQRENGEVWWEVVTRGGRNPTGMDLVEWAKKGESLGAGELVLNSIDADGVKDGYDNEMNRAVTSQVQIPVVASGGAGQLQHFVDGIVHGGVDAVLAASIFHFGEYRIADVKAYLAAHGIPVYDRNRRNEESGA